MKETMDKEKVVKEIFDDMEKALNTVQSKTEYIISADIADNESKCVINKWDLDGMKIKESIVI